MFTFPYQIKRIEEGLIANPKVTLNLKTIKGFKSVNFLLDSGADVTTFPLYALGGYFDFKPDKKEAIKIGGVEGSGVLAYPHKIIARLGSIEFPLRCYFIESNVDPLLGRLDFWNKFSITFDNKKRQTTISPV